MLLFPITQSPKATDPNSRKIRILFQFLSLYLKTISQNLLPTDPQALNTNSGSRHNNKNNSYELTHKIPKPLSVLQQASISESDPAVVSDKICCPPLPPSTAPRFITADHQTSCLPSKILSSFQRFRKCFSCLSSVPDNAESSF